MSNKLKCLIFFVFTIASSLSFAVDNPNFNAKIAIVEVQTLLENSHATLEIRKSINQISDDIQKELSKKESELKKIEEDLIKKRGVISDNEFSKEVANFNKKVNEAQKDSQVKKSKLEEAHAEAMAKVQEATLEIIGQLSEEMGFDLVFPSSQVLHAKSKFNITQEVLEHLNKKLKTVKVNYKY